MADNLTDAGARLSEHGKNIRDEAARGGERRPQRHGRGREQSRRQAREYASQGYEYAADKSKKVKETAQGIHRR